MNKTQELAKPFAPEVVQFKPGATTKDKSRALALAYVDSREYQRRLTEVFGLGWSDRYTVAQMDNKIVVTCELTLGQVTRCDVGECALSDPNAATIAKAQSFKRACAAFGLGAYLYDLPSRWVAYDAQRKRFTDEGLAQLRRSLGASSNQHYADGSEVDPVNTVEVQTYQAFLKAVGVVPESRDALRTYHQQEKDQQSDNARASTREPGTKEV